MVHRWQLLLLRDVSCLSSEWGPTPSFFQDPRCVVDDLTSPVSDLGIFRARHTRVVGLDGAATNLTARGTATVHGRLGMGREEPRAWSVWAPGADFAGCQTSIHPACVTVGICNACACTSVLCVEDRRSVPELNWMCEVILPGGSVASLDAVPR